MRLAQVVTSGDRQASTHVLYCLRVVCMCARAHVHAKAKADGREYAGKLFWCSPYGIFSMWAALSYIGPTLSSIVLEKVRKDESDVVNTSRVWPPGNLDLHRTP